MPPWLIPLLLLASVVALLVWRQKRRSLAPTLACEYWVYVRSSVLPSTEAFLDRMVSSNPFNKPGKTCIGAREGLLFTDVRFHMALAKKEKNPQAFRPDLAMDHLEVTADRLASLAEATALVVVRYATDKPVKDLRHLQFLPHTAGAILDLCDGVAVVDVEAQRLWTRPEFEALLNRGPRVDGFDLHCRVVWHRGEVGHQASTLGLLKTGRPDLETNPQEADQETLVVDVLRQASREAFRDPASTGPWTVEAFGDQYLVTVLTKSRGKERVEIGRIQPS